MSLNSKWNHMKLPTLDILTLKMAISYDSTLNIMKINRRNYKQRDLEGTIFFLPFRCYDIIIIDSHQSWRQIQGYPTCQYGYT